tara:strand:+ start:149 stop:772 length:624 start_codon:yes stop_codon:yes gene_type:complete
MEKTTSSERPPEALLRYIERGEPVVYPTSTLPALGVKPTKEGLDALFKLKGRQEGQPVSLMSESLEQVAGLVEWSEEVLELIEAFPRGSLTIVLPAAKVADSRLGKNGIGIRLAAHPLARTLLKCTGPLTATSANRSGMNPLSECSEAAAVLELPSDAVWNGHCPGGLPSTVIRIETNLMGGISEPMVIRGGLVSSTELNQWWMMRN